MTGARWNDDALRRGGPDSREGKVQVERFRADNLAPDALGHGVIGLKAMPGSSDSREEATYQAAVIDQLARAGYTTNAPAPAGGQVAEVRVTHDVVRPEEPRRSPVSGETTVGVSNRGSMFGMAINVDLSKPAKALVSTRLEARIRDRATNTVLWEGRADIVTRDGDRRWTQQKIASRLAGALFEDFPAAT